MVEKIIDKYLKKVVDSGLNFTPRNIPNEMLDIDQGDSNEMAYWKPIMSRLNNIDILRYETKLGYKLPNSYKSVLKHKHFYELSINDCFFYDFPSDCWFEVFSEYLELNSYMLEKGHIPFAELGQYGNSSTLCFNTNINSEENEYPIYYWNFQDVEFKFQNFESMLVELDKLQEKE